MEKSAERFRKYSTRLLTGLILLFTFTSLHAKNPTWDELRRLKFSKGQEYFFTATECPFYMNIENVRPENVQVSVNSLPDNVSFVSSKKEVLMSYKNSDDEYVTGTKLIVWFRFSTPGTYRLRSIDVVINGGYYRLGFESVEVFENPRFILPELKIQFDNPDYNPQGRDKKQIRVHAADHIVFTVYARYSVHINNFSWDIPENALFKQIRVYESLENQRNLKTSEFSPDYFPVATFDWQPLVKGNCTFPSILMYATAYNGSSYELTSPDYRVTVLEAEQKSKAEEHKSSFAYAFAKPSDIYQTEVQSEASLKNIQTLAELHCAERHAFPFFTDAKEKRQNFEQALNLPSADREPSIPLFIVLLSVSVLLIAAVAVLYVLRKIPAGVGASCFLIIIIMITLINGISLSRETAVYEGGDIFPIPEKNITSGANLQAGTVVQIVHSAGSWRYIKHNDTYGWVTEDKIMLIK